MEKNLKVLIADDSADLGQNCVKVLGSYGFNVILCKKDGEQLLDYIKTKKPDIVVADIFMPKGDIIWVMEQIKNIGIKDKPMIMAMTCYANEQLEKEILKAGVVYCFLKRNKV